MVVLLKKAADKAVVGRLGVAPVAVPPAPVTPLRGTRHASGLKALFALEALADCGLLVVARPLVLLIVVVLACEGHGLKLGRAAALNRTLVVVVPVDLGVEVGRAELVWLAVGAEDEDRDGDAAEHAELVRLLHQAGLALQERDVAVALVLMSAALGGTQRRQKRVPDSPLEA